MTCGIVAASAFGAYGHTSCKRQVSGSNPLTGSRSEGVSARLEREAHAEPERARQAEASYEAEIEL